MNAKGVPPLGSSSRMSDYKGGTEKRASRRSARQDGAVPVAPPDASDSADFTFGGGKDNEQKDELRQELERLKAQTGRTDREILQIAGQPVESGETARQTVPELLNLPVSTAVARLKKAGLLVGELFQEYSVKVPEGQVISQAPGPGGLAAAGARVVLVISKGKPPEKGGCREQAHSSYAAAAQGQEGQAALKLKKRI